MRYLFIFALVIFLASPSEAQRVRYKDLALALDTVSEGQRMSIIRDYLIEDPNHPNANYRLAVLHYQIYKKADPLLEYRKAMAHAREASLRMLRAKLLVDAQDVKSDNEYYAPFFKTVDSKGKPYVEFPAVLQQMTNAYDSSQIFLEKMPPIYRSFTRSVQQYDKAVKLFAAINNDYKTLEDIYMLFNKSLDDELEQLKVAFDSSVHYFKTYKSLTSSYPLNKYNQRERIKPIKVYRMDGLLTRFSFLTPEIELWDYAAWVNEVRKKYQGEIAGIKQKIEKQESQMSKSIKELETSDAAPSLAHLSKDLIFELNNYDKQSLALALLEYKNFKQEWLLKLKNVPRDTTIDSKLQLYSTLIQQNRVSDTLVSHVRAAINPFNIRKHEVYLANHYGGPSGLEKFVTDEQQWIDKTFGEYQEVLKQNLVAYNQRADSPGKFVKAGTFNIPLYAENKPVAAILPSTIVTSRIIHNPDGSAYLSGIHRMNKKTNFNAIGFVARLNPDGKAAWIKELNFSPDSIPSADITNIIGDMVSTQEGCALLITSQRQSDAAVVNNFVFVNDKGELKNFPQKETSMARKLIYQESGNSFQMVFKGSEEKQQYLLSENISITGINILGDLLWHQDIPVAGTLEDIVTVRDGYILAGNFSTIKNMEGQEIRTKINNGQSNPYLIKIGLRGELVKIFPVVSTKSVYIDKVVKVNDGSINLIGRESPFPQGSESPSGSLMHMMTTFELKSICANF